MEKEKTTVDPARERLFELMNKCNDANNPDPKARKEIQQLVRSNDVCREAMQMQEGMYQVVLRARIENMKASDSYKEVMQVKCQQLRDELGYTSASALEKLAIEQIVLCWFSHHNIEMQHSNILSQSHNIESGLYWEKRLTFSHRRYVRAMEMLSKMRKMNLIVKVNNANNQFINT